MTSNTAGSMMKRLRGSVATKVIVPFLTHFDHEFGNRRGWGDGIVGGGMGVDFIEFADNRRMLLRWGDQEVHVNDADELGSHLERLAQSASAPVLVSLVGSAGTLTLGLGHWRGGILLFADGDQSQPPLHSLGDADAGGDEVKFARGDGTDDFFPRCLIAHDVTLQAAREFFDSGTLPTCVTWEAEPVASNR